MLTTSNFGLRKPEGTDPVDIQDFNDNADIIDAELKKRPTSEGNASDMVVKFAKASARANLVPGEVLKSSLGKIMRWFADLKAVAFSGSYYDLADTPEIPKVLPADGGNADTVDGKHAEELQNYKKLTNTPKLGTAAALDVINNDAAETEGYVADARVVKQHGDEIDALSESVNNHKTSGDHDGRYYQKWEINNLLDEKISTSASCNRNWNWTGKDGQPTWVWGGEDGREMYVYNPSNFYVNKAVYLRSYNKENADGSYTYYTAYVTNNGNFRPDEKVTVDANGQASVTRAALNIGTENYYWENLYVHTAYTDSGLVERSDRNLKKDIKPLTDEYVQFFLLLQPVSFLFKDGNSGRTHVGFISQDVEDAMKQLGLSDLDFAGFCRDIKTRSYIDEEGNEVEEQILGEDGNPEYIYSLRYAEFIAINTFVLQETMKRLNNCEERLAVLENNILNCLEQHEITVKKTESQSA